jgi:prefoldin subunit 5
MPSLDVPESADQALEYYKSQIRELEAELADFQASSRELEQELEKELEASEKQHRDLRHKNETLRYEVDEWKVYSPTFVNIGEVLIVL